MGEYEYMPIDFSKINSVDIVDDLDKDYLEWREYIYNKKRKTKSQLRREKERKEFPEEWEELKNIYLNRKCGDCKKLYKYPDGYVCWRDGTPNKNYIPNSNYALVCTYFKIRITIHRNFCKHLNLYESNVNYYLSDLGVIEIPKTNKFKQAKEKENRFKEKLKEISEINIIEKFFKIYYTNSITFKFPDVIFKKDNKYSIIEYKTNAWQGNFKQILDYEKLFNMATIKELDKLYWIVCSEYWIQKIQRKAIEEYNGKIMVYSENEFLNLFKSKGPDAWM